MLERDRLLAIKNEFESNDFQKQYDKVIIKLEESIKQGYQGMVYGFYIPPQVGLLLNKQGIQYKTFTDGVFEESDVWV